MAAHAGELGVDPDRLAIAGDSAGGNLTAVVAQLARDAGTGARQGPDGTAPAYIAVAGYDPLRDDGGRYAELLAAAGVSTQVHNAETLIHGYLAYAGVVPAATDAMARGLSALREALHAT